MIYNGHELRHHVDHFVRTSKWVGKPSHPDMIAAAADRGYDLTDHRGTQIDENLLAWADLVLALDRTILHAVRDILDVHTAPTLALYLHGRDVPDPFRHPTAVFAACATLIEDGSAAHLRQA